MVVVSGIEREKVCVPLDGVDLDLKIWFCICIVQIIVPCKCIVVYHDVWSSIYFHYMEYYLESVGSCIEPIHSRG